MAHKITKLLSGGLLLLVVTRVAASEPNANALNQPRDPALFAALFARSPFAMASTVAQSPLSQRYSITGTMTVDDKPQLFLLDKTTQDRLMVSADHADGGVTLVALQADADPAKVQATIRVGPDTGVVTFEKAPVAPEPAAPNPSEPAVTIAGQTGTAMNASPPLPVTATAPPAAPGGLPVPPQRHMIRRGAAPIVPPPSADQAPPPPQ